MSNYAIIANGNFLTKEILLEAVKDRTIIALDGAADKLAALGLNPQLILGDFDSISPQAASYWGLKKTFSELSADTEPYRGNQGVLIVPALNQNLTDLDKALHYCDQQNAKSIIILCATGARLDHHESLILSLAT